MLKKTVTYTDFFGEERTEDFYFHMTKAELNALAVGDDGIIEELNALATDAKNGKKIIAFFRKFVSEAYGERSEDGRRFIKNETLSEEFQQTAAFDHLLNELLTGSEDPIEFMKAIIPADLAKAAEEQMQKQKGLPQDFRKKA